MMTSSALFCNVNLSSVTVAVGRPGRVPPGHGTFNALASGNDLASPAASMPSVTPLCDRSKVGTGGSHCPSSGGEDATAPAAHRTETVTAIAWRVSIPNVRPPESGSRDQTDMAVTSTLRKKINRPRVYPKGGILPVEAVENLPFSFLF